jgi:Protein of unknown function (DUF3800)
MSARKMGPTRSLGLALFHRWDPDRLFVIVTVYIDESGTHNSGVTIMGGWVARFGQWATFDPKWRKLLKRNGLTYFHSRKLRQTKGEFKGWSREKKWNFTQDAAKLGLKNLEFGFTIALPDAAYEEHYVAGYRPKEIPLDSRYGLCFRWCLSLIPGFAKEAFGDRELDMNFVLESGHPNAGDAERIFNRVKKQGLTNPAEVEIVKMLNVISFADKARFPGLQVADINAYSAFQHESGARPLELVTVSLEATMADAKKHQKVPIFRLELRKEELKIFKKFILDEIEEKKARSKTATRVSPSSGGKSS